MRVLILHDECHPIKKPAITEASVISILLEKFESELYWNGNEAIVLIRGSTKKDFK